MGSYLQLFSIEVEHMFFYNGLCPNLDFVPTHQTNNTLINAGLLTRKSLNGINLFYDEDRVDVLQLCASEAGGSLNLEFKVFARDPLFVNYTEPLYFKEDSILFFYNKDANIDTSGKVRLHDREYVSEMNFVKLGSPLITDVLNRKEKLVKPVFIVNIGDEEEESSLFDENLNVSPKKYYIKFNSRQTFWKYYLLGNVTENNLYITDMNGETEFEFAGMESLSDNRIASTFKSKTTLPMRERYDHCFQLKERGPGGEKVLIKRLPVASTDQINMEIIDGKETLISEIYINY